MPTKIASCKNASSSTNGTEHNCLWSGVTVIQETNSIFGIAMWILLLFVIIFLNVLVIYATMRIKTLWRNAFHRVVISNFISNILYGCGCCIKQLKTENMSCNKLVVLNFLELFGTVTGILGVMALSILQHKQLKSLDVNNKLMKDGLKRKRLHALYHLLYVWIIGLIFSIFTSLPLVTKNIMLLPITLALGAITLCIFFTCRTFMIITYHRRQLRRKNSSTAVGNLTRTESLLKGTGLILVVGWIPTLIGQILLLYLTTDRLTTKHLNAIAHIALLYPILHPMLYVIKTKEVKKFVTNKVIKCQSENLEKEEEFFHKLQIRKIVRRPIQIKPFIIENNSQDILAA